MWYVGESQHAQLMQFRQVRRQGRILAAFLYPLSQLVVSPGRPLDDAPGRVIPDRRATQGAMKSLFSGVFAIISGIIKVGFQGGTDDPKVVGVAWAW